MHGVQNAAYCYLCSVVWVCLLEITMSCAKTTEPIEMPFGMLTREGREEGTISSGAGRTPCDAAFRQNSLTTC